MLDSQPYPLPIFLGLLVSTLFVLYRYGARARNPRMKVLLTPLLLGACAVAVAAVGARLGFAAPAALPRSFEYIAHHTVVTHGEKRWIDLLLISRKSPGADARLHRTRWTRNLEEVLERAEQMKDGPGKVVLSAPGIAAGARGTGPAYSATWEPPQDRAPNESAPLVTDPFELLV
jgi:hypothetical protein